jgi:hypothetical protein
MRKTDELMGVNLMVYEDPFTRQKEEGRATVTKVVRRGTDDGVKQVEWADCWVRFDGEKEEYYRTVAYI